MQARTTFGQVSISKGLVALFVALLVAAYLTGGASGFLIKGISLPATTSTGASQGYALPDISTTSRRGGPQTVEEQSPKATAASDTGTRRGGLQIP